MSNFYRYFTLDYYLNNIGYTKAASLDIARYEPITDDDIESIDIDFARKTREVIRWLGANNTDIASIVSVNKSGVIGSSVNIQSRLKDSRELNDQIETFIKRFSKKKNCTTSGRWHLNSLFRSMVEFTDKDGGFLLKHHYNNAWEIPYRVELIEVGMIDISKENKKDNILNGLQKDSYGKITHVWLFENQDRINSKAVSMDDMDFFSPVWISISQYTAVSKLSASLPTIDKLDQYSDAELQAAIERAKAGLYWKTSMYDDIMKIIKNEKDEAQRKIQMKQLMKTISDQGVKPSGLTPIPLGDDIVKTDRESGTVYDMLTKNNRQGIAASVGLSAQIAYQDSSDSNYSSIKAMMAFASIEWATRFDDLRHEIIDPMMERLIATGVMMGAIDIPDYFQNPDNYLKLEYVRVTEIDIEPSKTASADATKLENGTISKREIARRRGRNYEDVLDEQLEDELLEIQMRKEKGLPPKVVEQKEEVVNGTTN